MASGSVDNAPITMQHRDKPKDILGAISEIEILSSAEETGTDMPDRFATLKDRMDYFNLGMRSIFTGTLLSLLLAPISAAVINKQMPIFGNFEPTILDMILAYIISFGYSIGFMMLFVYVAKIRGGTVSNIITNNLMTGMTVGTILKLLVAIFVYGLLYFMILTETHIKSAFEFIGSLDIVSARTYHSLWYIVDTIRGALIPSIYIYAVTSGAMLLIPWSVRIYKTFKVKREEF